MSVENIIRGELPSSEKAQLAKLAEFDDPEVKRTVENAKSPADLAAVAGQVFDQGGGV